MKNLRINGQTRFSIPWMHLIVIAMIILLWFIMPVLIKHFEPTAALIDMGVLQLVLLGMVCYFALITLCWRLLKHFWLLSGLPNFEIITSHFNELNSCQQLGFYWASFALLLLAGVACLASII